MRKSILAAVAAGALAIGSAASAQDIGSVIGSLFGYGNAYPTYNAPSTPAVVAGTVPYGAYGTYGTQVPYGTQIYTDQSGRSFYYDQYGRQIMVQSGGVQYNIVGYDSQGRPLYGTDAYGPGWGFGSRGNYAYNTDRDRDGVPDAYDRYPDDPRYR